MENSKLSFEDFDYDKTKEKLPEGYEPIEYLEISSPKVNKLIAVASFNSFDAAGERINELSAKYPSCDYQIMPNQIESKIINFKIIVPESCKNDLRPGESILNEATPLVKVDSFEPCLYRFLNEEKYQEDFFEKGELLLSTFKRCKTKEVGERQDKYENQNKIVIADGKQRLETVVGYDFETLVLCTSITQKGIKKDYSLYKYGFKIKKPKEFFDILTRALVTKGISIAKVLKGPCIYNNKKITIDATGTGLIKDLLDKSQKGFLDFNPTMQYILSNAQNEIMMNKPTDFAYENEYRFIWLLTSPIKKEYVSDDVTVNDDGSIVIRVPELVQFCERL